MRPRAGRFFPSAEATVMEILDEGEDPTIEIDVIDSNGRAGKKTIPDPGRMSKAVFDTMIMTDPVLRVLADGETISALSDAAMGAARQQAADLAGELVGVKAKLAEAVHDLARAKARIAELEAAAGKPAAVPPADADDTEVPGKPVRSRR